MGPCPWGARFLLNLLFYVQPCAPSNLAKKEVDSVMALSSWVIFSGPGFLLFEKVTLGTHLLLMSSSSTPGPTMFIINHSAPLLFLNKRKLGLVGKYVIMMNLVSQMSP